MNLIIFWWFMISDLLYNTFVDYFPLTEVYTQIYFLFAASILDSYTL
jgi:hypothetical protein